MMRSFGPMSGGGGGGGMMRTVHRAVRAGSGGRGSSEEPFYHSTINHTSRPTYKPSSSDNHNNSNTLSLSPNHQLSAVTHLNSDEYDDFVFCSVPSVDEVHHAVSSLQQVLDPAISNYEDWIEPSTSMLQSQSVYDAFRLLQTEPSVKKMVISLSSDKSVWEAVMNNEAVRELRDSINQANKSILDKLESSDHGSIPVLDVIKWIFNNTKAKMMEIIEKTTKLFQSPRNENKTDVATEPFEKKLTSSFMLSVIVILIVVVTRVSRS